MLTCYVCSTKIGEISDISKCFENFVSQTLGVLTRIYAAELRLHTIRANYPLWEKRIKDIQEGHAVLSVRQWSGKPYRSKQVEIAQLTAENGVGIQKLSFDKDKDGVLSLKYFNINGKYIDRVKLANNDGLSLEYWQEWFSCYDLSKPLAIIHFTKFRY